MDKETSGDQPTEKVSDEEAKKKHKPVAATNNGIKNASTASITQKVLQEQEQLNKRRKMAQNDNVKSLFSKSEAKPNAANSADYMTRGFSIGKK